MRFVLSLSIIAIAILTYTPAYSAEPGAITSLAWCLDATQKCKLKDGCAKMSKRLRACENMRNRKAQGLVSASSQKKKNSFDRARYLEPADETLRPIFPTAAEAGFVDDVDEVTAPAAPEAEKKAEPNPESSPQPEPVMASPAQ